MPAMNEFNDAMTQVIRSSAAYQCIRGCLLVTRDRDHAFSEIRKVAAALERPLRHFTVAGCRRFSDQHGRWEDEHTAECSPYDLLQRAQALTDGGVVVLDDCAGALQDEQGHPMARMLMARLLSAETRHQAGIVLVLLERPGSERLLPEMLSEQILRLSVDYPRSPELVSIAREVLGTASHQAGAPLDMERLHREADQLALECVGLTRSAARAALRDALASGLDDMNTANDRLKQAKRRKLSQELAMRTLDSCEVEEPVGLENLMEYVGMVAPKMRIWGPGRARGILLVGPPGTGKTMLARAIGQVVDLPVVEFRIASLMNSLLGETERRFAQAFDTLAAMSPNVVFIDEIEKAFGDSGERDGGTMMRCTGALLSWLSDNENPNYIVATANSLSRMGEIGLTMTRSERFDTCFFVDVPTAAARQTMLSRWLADKVDGHQDLAHDLARDTDRFSGADLRSAVKLALMRSEHKNEPLPETLRRVIAAKRSRVLELFEEFDGLRAWGRKFCDPAGR